MMPTLPDPCDPDLSAAVKAEALAQAVDELRDLPDFHRTVCGLEDELAPVAKALEAVGKSD